MRVERFFLFFGPTIWSFKRGETEYGIKAIPLGGYVKITGMNPEEEVPPEVEHRAYYRQPVWKRIVVIGAGPGGQHRPRLRDPLRRLPRRRPARSTQTVGEVDPAVPGAPKVLQPGDRIVAVDGQRYPGLGARSTARTVRQADRARTNAPASRSTAAWRRRR